MQFTKTYTQTSFDNFYRPYYFINNKRVSENEFELTIQKCEIKNMTYNSPVLTYKNNRYKATFYYN